MSGMLTSLVLFLVLADAARSDILHFCISNRASLLAAAGVVPVALVGGWGWSEFGLHLAAGFVVLSGGAALFAMNVWGGGDAKLLAAVSLWTGFPDLPRLLLVTALSGGILALAALAAPRLPFLAVWGRRCRIERGVPYGLAIALGGVDWLLAGLLNGGWS